MGTIHSIGETMSKQVKMPTKVYARVLQALTEANTAKREYEAKSRVVTAILHTYMESSDLDPELCEINLDTGTVLVYEEDFPEEEP